jgi:hypothetical protein
MLVGDIINNDLTLKKFLEEEKLRKYFVKFTIKEHSNENLKVWDEIKKFKSLKENTTQLYELG